MQDRATALLKDELGDFGADSFEACLDGSTLQVTVAGSRRRLRRLAGSARARDATARLLRELGEDLGFTEAHLFTELR